jgi:hypothetical protein
VLASAKAALHLFAIRAQESIPTCEMMSYPQEPPIGRDSGAARRMAGGCRDIDSRRTLSQYVLTDNFITHHQAG